MADEAVLTAVTAVIRSLATGSTSSRKYSLVIPTCERQKIAGNDSDAKEVLEIELGLLAQRIYRLEHAASWAVNPVMPATPNDTAVTKPPFSDADKTLPQSHKHTPCILITCTTSPLVESTLDDDLLNDCGKEA